MLIKSSHLSVIYLNDFASSELIIKKKSISLNLNFGYKSCNYVALLASHVIAAIKRATTTKEDMNKNIRDLSY